MKDDENNPITIDFNPKLNCIKIINDSLIIHPVSKTDIGDFLINVTISDGQPLCNY